MFDSGRFTALLTTRALGRVSRRFDTLGSTNEYLLHGPALPFGAAVTAERQTAGRGRLGRHWESPPGTSLSLSVLCGPFPAAWESAAQTGLLPLACAVAAADALSSLGGHVLSVKWPNDVLGEVNGAFYKVCGILCEAAARPDGRAVVCGFGVNLGQDGAFFKQMGLPHAASLRMLGGRAVSSEEAAAAILNMLEPLLGPLVGGGDTLLARYRGLCMTPGRPVRFLRGSAWRQGTAVSIGPDGGLVVQTEAGPVTLHAGDVLVRGADGLV